MKISHFSIIAIFTSTIISCQGQSPKNNQQHTDTGIVKETKIKENLYPELRNKSLITTPEQLNLKLAKDKVVVYGVVMDWDMSGVFATIVAFQTGDASLYVSAGQIYIGGYAHENVRTAGLAFVKEAQNYLSLANETTDTNLPNKGYVKFYFLTNKGRYSFQETVEKLINKQSRWTNLFELGNNVITEYRAIIDK